MSNKIKVKVENLNLYYGENHALKDVNMDIQENAVTAFIGPSGCGKSTFLKTLNRMNSWAISDVIVYAHRKRIRLLEYHSNLLSKDCSIN